MTTTGGARPVRASRPGPTARIDTLVVGAGQAGLALSYHLTAVGHDHVLLERGRVGQRWHDRWDSLTLLSPNWMNRLPGGAAHGDPDGFLPRTEFIAYLEAYARSFEAPIVEGVEVTRISRHLRGFRIQTTGGEWVARRVVLASGDAAVPHVPFAVPPAVESLHAAEYRRPELLPDGPVLVVGAGATGQQLALELHHAGRDVMLATGRHSRAPRTYRGRDIFEWLDLLGDFDRTVDEIPNLEAAKRVPLFPLSGANGGEDIGLDRLGALGVVATGRLAGFDGFRAVFGDDLAGSIASADARVRKLLRRIDSHPLARGTHREPLPDVVVPGGPQVLELRSLGAVVWATGFRRAYPWLRIRGALDARGEIVQRQGATRIKGLYVLGLAYQYRRSSHFIGGVGLDAETIARRIVGSVHGGRRAAVPAHAV
jgi:putative flavoprotein involved in K+ transport